MTARRSWEDVTTTSITLLLGAAAFAGSYTHIRDVAAANGQGGWISYAIAASVDFMAVGSGLEIRRRRRNDTGAKWPMFTLLLSVGMTLGANLATAGPGPWGALMAVWPAVAFLSVAGLLETRTRRVAVQDSRAELPATELGPVDTTTPDVEAVTPDPGDDPDMVPATSPRPDLPRAPRRKPDGRVTPDQSRAYVAAHPDQSRDQQAAALGLSARTLARHLQQPALHSVKGA